MREAYPRGDVIWHTGLAVQFNDAVPRQLNGAIKGPPEGGTWPATAKTMHPVWSCRSRDRMWHLFDQVRPVAARFGFHVLDALSITEPWTQATIDNRHYEGGKKNKLKQVASIAILNELLNLLSRLAARRGESHAVGC